MNQNNSNKFFNDSTNTASGKPKFMPPQKRVQQDQPDQPTTTTETQQKTFDKPYGNENRNEPQREYKTFSQQQKPYNNQRSNYGQNSNYSSNAYQPQKHYGHGFHNQSHSHSHHQSHSVDPTTGHHSHGKEETQNSRFSGSFFGRQIIYFLNLVKTLF